MPPDWLLAFALALIPTVAWDLIKEYIETIYKPLPSEEKFYKCVLKKMKNRPDVLKDEEIMFKSLASRLALCGKDKIAHERLMGVVANGLQKANMSEPEPQKLAEEFAEAARNAYDDASDLLTPLVEQLQIAAHEEMMRMLNVILERLPQFDASQRQEIQEKLYLRHLIDGFNNQEVFGSRVFLGQLFVEPEAKVSYKGQKESGPAGVLISGYLNKEHAIIIESHYGMGKSTLCRWMAAQAAEKRLKDDNEPFPIYLALRSYNKQTLEIFVRDVTTLNINRAHEHTFFLDGFDELALLRPEAKEEFVRSFPEWLDQFSRSKFIIATRPNYELAFSSWKYEENVPLAGLEKFDTPRIKEWTLKWNAAQTRKPFSMDDVNQLPKRVRELMGNPLLLFIAADSSDTWRKDEVNSEADIYEAYLQATKEGRHKDPYSLVNELQLTPDQYVDLLQEIAYLIFTQREKEGCIRADQLKKGLKDDDLREAIEKLEHADRVKDVFLCYFFQRFEKDKRACFEFAHQSMMEYLVARRIVELLKKAAFSEEDIEVDIMRGRLGGALASPLMIQFAKERLLRLEKDEQQRVMELLKVWYESWNILFYGDANIKGYAALHREQDKSANIRVLALTLLIPLSDHLEQPYAFTGLGEFLHFLASIFIYMGHYDILISHLHGANLREANLWGANLRGADLSEANLSEANLEEADLREANLRKANLRGANLLGANLPGASLGGAYLKNANLVRANLMDANMGGADMEDATLRRADLAGADLQDAILVRASLEDANLDGANLRGADLQEANLRGANLRGVDLGGANLYVANIFHVSGLSPEEIEKLLKGGAVERPYL